MREIRLIHVVESSEKIPWFEHLFSHLDSKGFDQTLVTLEPKQETETAKSYENIAVWSTDSKKIVKSSLQVIAYIFNLRSKTQINFLVLHGHKASIVGAVAARAARMNFGIVHHVQPHYFQLLKHREPLRGLLHFFLYRGYSRMADINQSLSSEVTQYLLELNCDTKRIVEIGHGVDFKNIQRKLDDAKVDEKISSKFPRILMVGRLAWEKNYPLAIAAFAEICKLHPEAVLVIAGTGPAENEIKLLIEKFNLVKNVFLIGRSVNVPELMVNSDLLLHLALTESYGQIFIEACLTDLPIFTFPTGIAIDLAAESDSLVHILTQSDPREIAKRVNDFLSTFRKRESLNFMRNAAHYSEHCEDKVFENMSNYFSNLVPKLSRNSKKKG